MGAEVFTIFLILTYVLLTRNLELDCLVYQQNLNISQLIMPIIHVSLDPAPSSCKRDE